MDHYHEDTDPLLLCHFLHAHPYFLHLPVSQRGREKMHQNGNPAVQNDQTIGITHFTVHTGRDNVNMEGHLQHACDALWDSLE